MLFTHNLNKGVDGLRIMQASSYCVSSPINPLNLTESEISDILNANIVICRLCNKPILDKQKNQNKDINANLDSIQVVEKQTKLALPTDINKNETNSTNTENINQDLKQEEEVKQTTQQQESKDSEVEQTTEENKAAEEIIVKTETVTEENNQEEAKIENEKELPKKPEEEKIERPTSKITREKSKSTGNLNTNNVLPAGLRFKMPKYALLNPHDHLFINLDSNTNDNAVSFARRNLTLIKTNKKLAKKCRIEDSQVLRKLSLELRQLYVKLNPNKAHAVT